MYFCTPDLAAVEVATLTQYVYWYDAIHMDTQTSEALPGWLGREPTNTYAYRVGLRESKTEEMVWAWQVSTA